MSTRALLMAAAAAPAAPGQVEFTTAGTHTWTVPDGVYSICAVLVQGSGAAASTLTYAATLYGRALNGARIGDGGGDGGSGGAGMQDDDGYAGGGGGGAGGYAGNGANGARSPGYTGVPGSAAPAGSGAGGSGNAPQSSPVWDYTYGGGGGGVGLKGKGADGAQGGGGSGGSDSYYIPGTPQRYGGNYGGGTGGGVGNSGNPGGALSYKNDIPVTPGTTVSIVVAGNGGARILWGDGRFYPSTNTGDA